MFSGDWILPQGFFIGPMEIRYYGIIMALAVAAGYFLAVKTSAQYEIEKKQSEDLLFWVIVGGFAGARLYHVASSFDYYSHNLLSALQVWNGGLSIYGAVLGGLFAMVIYNKVIGYKLSVMSLADWLTPSIILGQIIGRFGNMFNYEAFGYPTGAPWKMFVPLEFRPIGYFGFQFFHPWFLYEILANVIIFLALAGIFKKRFNILPGGLFLTYVLLYNVVRFLLEFSRIDSVFIGSLRQNAIVSLAFVLSAAFVFKFLKKNGQIS